MIWQSIGSSEALKDLDASTYQFFLQA